jgi:hypothetical protein
MKTGANYNHLDPVLDRNINIITEGLPPTYADRLDKAKNLNNLIFTREKSDI